MAIFINLLGIFGRFAASADFWRREPFGVHRDQPNGCSLLGHLRSPSPSGFHLPNLLQNINKSYHKN